MFEVSAVRGVSWAPLIVIAACAGSAENAAPIVAVPSARGAGAASSPSRTDGAHAKPELATLELLDAPDEPTRRSAMPQSPPGTGSACWPFVGPLPPALERCDIRRPRDATTIESQLQALCRLPRRGRVLVASPAELMQHVHGRWYRCKSGGRGMTFPSPVAWPGFAQGLWLQQGTWQLLELAGDADFVPAVARDIEDRVSGNFGTSTYDAFYADVQKHIGPVPMAVPPGRSLQETNDVPVMTVPFTRSGFIVPVEPVFSISPPTMTLNQQRYVAIGEPAARAVVAARRTSSPPPLPGMTPDLSAERERLEALCRQPRKVRLEPKSPTELTRLVRGRWYHCGNNKRALHFPTYWSEGADAMELAHGRWTLLELDANDRFRPARTRNPGERVAGTFSATTRGAFMGTAERRARTMSLPIPVSTLSETERKAPVLTVPQPRDGVIFPVEPVVTDQPRTLTLNGQRFVAIDAP